MRRHLFRIYLGILIVVFAAVAIAALVAGVQSAPKSGNDKCDAPAAADDPSCPTDEPGL
jgi:hypothetical protein